jgi:uncharacterized membrane protein YedE/YeeE
MTDLLSVLFLIGLSLVLHIVALILKNTVLIIVSGLGWALVATYLFNVAGSGDPDFGRWTVGLGYFATILSLSAFFTSWWIHRKKTLQTQNDKTGETFYTEGDPEFKEINDMYKARANKKKLRGR